MNKIFPREVIDITDAQLVRQIRNELSESMTNFTSKLSPEDQIHFFRKHRVTQNRLYLYMGSKYELIGFSYIRYEDNGYTEERFWGTLGVLPEFQNQGYGTEIYKHMLSLVSDLWIEIYSDNNPSLVAALKAGLIINHIDDKIIVLRGGNDDTSV